MGVKFRDMGTQDGERWIAFHCPGCQGGHSIPIEGRRKWTWNGSFELPTIAPSIFVNRGGANPTQPVCHSWVTDGKIMFLNDCTHALKNQTVEIPDWEGA
jgi:Family of unknown function (DUF6527)